MSLLEMSLSPMNTVESLFRDSWVRDDFLIFVDLGYP